MEDDTFRDLDFAGVETLDAFGLSHAIVIPPSVRVRTLRSPLYPAADTTPTLIFPVPPAWPRRASTIDLQGLFQAGWLPIESTDGLLKDFLRLGDCAADEADPAAVPEVRRFAQRWGPLWLCRNPHHRQFCFWRVTTVAALPEQPCQWVRTEEVGMFLQLAQMAKAVLLAGHYLLRHEPVPAPIIRQLRPSAADHDYAVPQQKALLRVILNTFLLGPTAVHVRVSWRGEGKPLLTLHGGLGFLGVIWLEIAQNLCGVAAFCACDSCGRLYQPEGRRPPHGRRNYCPACGKGDGYRAAKLLSARPQRARPRPTGEGDRPQTA